MVALAAVMVTIAAPFIAIEPAAAGILVGPFPDFPTTSTVGGTFAGRLNLINNSTPPQSVQPIAVTEIRFVPACKQRPQ